MPDQFQITGLDIGIVLTYLIISRIIPIVLNPKSDTSEGYFLGSRNFTWPLIGFSLFASNMSGTLPVGLAGAGYNQGIAVYSYEFMAALILVVFVLFILPFYLRTGVYTVPEFFEKRYDARSRTALSGFMVFTHIFIDMAAGLYAGALVVQLLFPTLPLWITVAGLMGVSMIYMIFGGLGAVMISDSIQACVIIIGGAIVFFVALQAIPSWDAVREAAPPGALNIVQPADDENLPWPGLLTGLILLGFYYWTSNQFMVQRTLGARSLDHGRLGGIFAGFLKIPILFIMILPGTMAIALYPNLDNPDVVFPTMIFDLLPIWLRGIVLASLVAAITSTVDSILNAVSTMVTMDFVRKARPNLGDHALVNVGRITTVFVAVIVIIWSPQIVNFPSLWSFLQSGFSYLTPPIVATFFLGLLWPRATGSAAFWTLATMIPLGILFFVLNQIIGVFAIHFLYAAAISFVGSLALLVGISLATPAPDPEVVRELTWRPYLWRQETEELKGKPLYKNYRFWAVTLVISVLIVVFIFR